MLAAEGGLGVESGLLGDIDEGDAKIVPEVAEAWPS